MGGITFARGYSLRHAAITVSAALLAIEGVSSLGLALPITGWGAARMALDVAIALALALLAAARIPAPPAIARLFARLRPLALLGAALLLAITCFAFLNDAQLILFVAPARSFVTDVIGFTDECARLTLAGHNPYTSAASGFAEALRRFPLVIPTPLRSPLFGAHVHYPTRAVVAAVERRYLANPTTTPGAFDPRTLTSYPALSFLLYLPLIWLGAPNILLLNLLVFVALLAWLIFHAPRHERFWTALTVTAALPMLLYSLTADTEVIALVFILIAWALRRHRWASAIALGLGCAFRQYCWFFAPFVLLDVLLHRGWREATRRTMIAVGAFLLPNLPFIIAEPQAWWTSIWLPLTEPLYPLGVGLVALTNGQVGSYTPTTVFTALEIAALLVCLLAQWRWRKGLGDAALLLALIPLYFSWRSLPNYFALAPLLALYAVVALARMRAVGEQQPVVASPTT